MAKKSHPKKKSAKPPKKPVTMNILVTGDVLYDCNIYEGKRATPGSTDSLGTKVIKSRGGAGLLYDIIKELIERKNDKDKIKTSQYAVGFDLDSIEINKLNTCHHSFAFWRPCLKEAGSKEKKYVWRMTQPLGYGDLCKDQCKYQINRSGERRVDPRIVLIDDGALGFRSDINKSSWPLAITGEKEETPEWIILKMSGPVAQGDLFRKVLDKKFKDRLIIVVSINDIRREEVGITKGLSWERTAQDLLLGLKFNPRMRNLKECRHLIISFGSEGVLWLNRQGDKTENNLVFDPANLEFEWGEQFEGSAFGTLSCLTAGIVDQLTMPEGKMRMQDGIMSGLSAIRRLKLEGHGDKESSNPGFPLSGVVEEMLKHSKGYSCVEVPSPPNKPGAKSNHWTILGGTNSNSNGYPLYGLARRVALFGKKELGDIPYSKFGKLFTVDRSEIESLRGIQRLIKDYEAKKRPKKPLSIAVFGPPGSGKSFGIKQIAKSIMGDDVPILEFNLSQFTGPNELTDAFHQVRDMVLKGKTPCVFWDEFDSREYVWLQYLLAPMQDGEFREGPLVHPIGKCVFVFAGGTSYDMENFGPPDENSEGYKKFKMLKGPDFASRLNGYLNVLGPNKRQIFDRETGNWINDENPEDICYPVRRALLMRVMLGYSEDDPLGIDSGLLTAFIEIDKYKHGARSLETILLLSKRDGAKTLRRSDLPPREQMSLHVNYDKFIDLVNRDLPFKLNRKAIAPSVHEFFRKLGEDEGWIKEKPKMDKPYKDLDEDIKEDNLAAAERIPDVLRLLGLEIVTKEHSDKMLHVQYNKLFDDKNDLERLAEAEHDGWWEFKLLNGWEYDEVRNDDLKKHNCLISYNKLSETDKNKDRNSVKSYFEILENAGYQIIRSK
jgi:RyR domain/ATPase family associated with various cellular activities (AAA)